jgi:penicillin-binding protein 2
MSLLTVFLVLVTCSSLQQQPTDLPTQAPDTTVLYTKRRVVLPEVPQRGRILDRHDSVLVATRPQY